MNLFIMLILISNKILKILDAVVYKSISVNTSSHTYNLFTKYS